MTDPRDTINPQNFLSQFRAGAAGPYLGNPAARKLIEFFDKKGLASIKEEDQRQIWYQDWLSFQAEHKIYASMLSPREFSSMGHELDLLKITRFVEVFGYLSPAHGYSFQVTFLGLFSILMGENAALKREAVASLEAGGLMAFGVSEKSHGSDLLANEFAVREISPEKFLAGGKKYYIGNANCASIVSILAHKVDDRHGSASRRALPVMVAIRPQSARGFANVKKTESLGIRAAFVGEFEVTNHEFPKADLIAEGRAAWDCVFGTVTLGKFFLGFGSIGICEHAMAEAAAHLSQRILYGKPVIEMPHIRTMMAQAYARLTGMKLYAYRALDYVQSARETDRRYILFNAVQKAKVSTEGVKVMALMSECMGAKGFESDTYFEMALRDAQLIPGLEGSTHINLATTAQFIPKYFGDPDANLAEPKSLAAGETASTENPYLMEARTGSVNNISFAPFLDAYQPLLSIPNVAIFAKQAGAFASVIRDYTGGFDRAADMEITISLGRCLASIAYGQLICENAKRFAVPPEIISVIFDSLVQDMNASALALASSPRAEGINKSSIEQMVTASKSRIADWDFVAARVVNFAQ
jgi:acyl-CoA dehydrogenase